METPDPRTSRPTYGRIINTGILVLNFILIILTLNGQNFQPGKERWPVKTSVTSCKTGVTVTLQELLKLPSPVSRYTKKSREDHYDHLFEKPVGENHLREGDIITTYGYILLAAVEQDENGEDGDYHVQIRTTADWNDSCIIVEVPYPPFIRGNKALRDSVSRVREFFDKQILMGRKKVCFGSTTAPSPYVKLTGQLFFDAHHMNTAPRGKQNSITKEHMKSYTCWEIHPVISIRTVKRK